MVVVATEATAARVELLCSQGRYTEAEAACTELVAAAQGAGGEQLALAYNNRGHVRYLQVDFPGALRDLEQAVKVSPSLAPAHYNWATIHYRLGSHSTALHGFQRALGLSPDNLEFREAERECREQGGL